MEKKFNKNQKLCITLWINILSGVVGENDEWTHKLNIFVDNNSIKIRSFNRGFATDKGLFEVYKLKLSDTPIMFKHSLLSMLIGKIDKVMDLYNSLIENYTPLSTCNFDVRKVVR